MDSKKHSIVTLPPFIVSILQTICLTTMLMAHTLNGQDRFRPEDYEIQQYTVMDDLASSEVYYTFRDCRGYIWFGTDNGVSRFDGKSFRNYGVAEGLDDPVIFQIIEDHEDLIYFYSMSGNIYVYKKNSIEIYKHNIELKSRLLELDLISNYSIAHSKIEFWDNKLVYIPHNKKFILTINSSGNIKTHTIDEDSYISIVQLGDRTHYFINYNLRTKIDTLISTGAPESIKINVTLIKDLVNIHRFTTEFKISPGWQRARWAVKKVSEESFLFSINEQLFQISQDSITLIKHYSLTTEAITVDNNGGIWIGNLNNGGLWFFENMDALNKGKGELILDNTSVSSIGIDPVTKRVWVGTLENGVFSVYNPPYFYIARNNISNIEFGKGDTLYTVESQFNINAVNLSNGNKIPLSKYFNESIRDIHYSSTYNKLWLCQTTISYLKGNHFIPVWYEDTNSNFIKPVGNRKITEQNENLYVTANHGFGIFNQSEFEPTARYYNLNERNSIIDPYTVVMMHDSTTLLGTRTGLMDFFGNPPDNPVLSKIDGDIIRIDLLQDSSMIISTANRGIYYVRNDIVLRYTYSNSILPPYIEISHLDSEGNLWIGSSTGLFKCVVNSKPSQLQIQYYGNSIPSKDIKDIDSNDSLIAVAAGNGVYIFSKNTEPDTAFVPIYFDEIHVNGSYFNKDSLYDLRPRENNLRVTLSYVNNFNTPHFKYRYKLNTSDQWIISDDKNLQFVGLNPGNYVLKAQTMNAMGVWGAESTLEWSILAPFWKRQWFILLMIVLTAAIIIQIARNRLNSIKYRLATENEIVKLERSLLRSQLNPHFIFNILNSIQGFILHGENKDASRYLNAFSKFMRSVLNVSKQESINLAEELKYAEEYLMLESIRISQELDYQITIEPGINVYEYAVPPMILQPILENCFKHGFKGLDKECRIDINIQKCSEGLLIKVRDNGKGLTIDNGNNDPNNAFGSYLTRKRLQLFNKHDSIESFVARTLKGPNNEVQGTEVSIRLNGSLDSGK